MKKENVSKVTTSKLTNKDKDAKEVTKESPNDVIVASPNVDHQNSAPQPDKNEALSEMRGQTQLEAALIEQGIISNYILLPSDIETLWKSMRVKDELVKFLQEKYKPKSQFEQEKVEYNQINILAEFLMYNIIFAKNELLFDNFKISMLVDLFWQLLEFDPEDDSHAHKEEEPLKTRKSIEGQDSQVHSPTIEFRGEDMEVDHEF